MAAVFSAAFLAGAPALAQTDEAMQILQGGQTQRIAPIGGELAMPTPEATPLSGTTPVSERPLTPFGSSLFEQQSLTARSQAINPGYRIAPGDQVQVAVWGAWEFAGTLTVDLQGNIFLPEIGPIQVAGLPNQGLDQAVRRGIARVFTGNVHSYTNLLTSQPISVFVTGAVMRPGRYAGARLDTLLYYLAAAGGINPRAGSYRHVSVLRGGRELARVDLYDFILNGRMPEIQFTDNDTVVVAPLGPTIEVHGDVRNSHIFEVAPEVTTGAQVMAVAGPNPSASHVAVSGLRDGQPYNAYVPLDQFAELRVRDGDNYTFQTDRVDQTIFVSVTGHAGGPSSFAVRRSARLGEVLNLIAIDPDRADLDAIYLRRKSAAERQARALEVSLQELQRSVLLTSSDTPSEAAIRVQEAQLVERFIGKARAVEPEGRVVLGNRQGHMDLRLEPEDEIVIPLRSDVILVSGEVRAPQSLLYVPGRSVREYIADAGGFTERGGDDMYVVQRLNGTVETTSNPELRPGDHLMILPEIDSKAGAVFKDIVEIIYRIAVSSGVVINILDDK
ncbi:polysaccharide biosynthesis/export family protein [Novispirillum sp. DQ9]|uniref:polysaccharide biosynthesis/export family protein n=1 Tax=Novispirillum sp. DQ9 TaxID=3398612 RepID=UPI003C7E7B05